MLTYIPSIEALERFKAEVKREEENLLSGKCQLCIDALLFLTPIQAADESLTTSMRILDEISPNYTVVPPIILSGDEYLRNIISRCPCVKIVCPSSIPFNGYVDLSPLESCIALELVRIPFSRLTGISGLRNRLRSLIWIRGYKDDEPSEEPSNSSIFTSFSYNPHTLKGNLKIDEIFWDQFGTWPLLNYLCISQSNISHINASTMPPSIKTIDLRMNRVYHFSNRANYSLVSTITKLCLDYNSLKELPKLNDNTCATLVHLSLRGNRIESVVGLRNFIALDYLDLSENSICDVRQLLNELMHLAKTLKTVHIEQNPVSYANSFASQCQSVLYQLVTFNGKPVKRTVRRARGTISDSSLLPVANIDAAFQASTSSVNRYGTFLPREDVNDSLQTNQTSDLEESFRSKTKPSKERFVVINEQGDEEGVVTLPAAYNTAGPSTRVTIEIQAEVNPILSGSKSKKNYLFGGVSGSYGSYLPLATGETAVADVSGSSVKSTHLTDEIILAEKSKLLQKREELGDDWLLGGGQNTPAVLVDNSLLLNINETSAASNKEQHSQSETTVVATGQEEPLDKQLETTPKPMPKTTASSSSNLDETCEWDDEDTEDENTVFLVEIYSNEGEFLSSVASEISGDYFFIRVRPRDGLLFEKDCTTGKVLTTLDLKILEHYQCLPRDAPESEARALRLIFDTTITSKRERVYCFVEDNQCDAFIRLYLSSYGQYKSKFEADLLATGSFNSKGGGHFLSTTPLAGNRSGGGANGSHVYPTTPTWFYMCLRCGFRTPRIITDCSQCHSDLIIKDNGGSSNSGLDFQASAAANNRASTPLQSNSPKSNCQEASEEMFSSGAFSQNTADAGLPIGGRPSKDSSSLVSEEYLDSEPSTVDESFFKANIDHYLKLHIEIYIYEQIDDTELKSESIESVCHCMALDFATNNLTPALVVFTQNYFFVFDHLLPENVSKHQPQESQVRLRFYRQLAGPKASPFIISHLPEMLKNQGYWIECGLSTAKSNGGKASKKKSKRRKRSKPKLSEYALELLLFDDKVIGKAFLQLLMHSHRSCFRALGETNGDGSSHSQLLLEANLVAIKADITELSHVDEERVAAGDVTEEATTLMKRNKVALHFDEACQRLLNHEQRQQSKVVSGRVRDAYSPPSPPPAASSSESTNIFLVRSFNLISAVTSSSGRGKHSPLSGRDSNAFKVQQNLVFIVSQDSLLICQLVARLGAIAALTGSLRTGQSMAQALQSTANFEDSLDVRLLIKDLIVNLLPNIYIDKAEMMLVLRFRDEDNGSHTALAGHSPTTTDSHSSPRPRSGLIVYDYQITFNSVNTLKRACRLIQSLWEENFGVSLTLSKHVPLFA